MFVSIIIEWDNPRLAGTDRAVRMLRELASQLRESLDRGIASFEVLIGGTKDVLVPDVDERIHAVWREAAQGLPELQLNILEDGSYYMLKNAMASRASGDIVIFLDSDVVPEPRWLAGMLAPFSNSSVQVVCANSYVELGSLFGRIMALIWFFPLRSVGGAVRPVERFFANSVAFRRELFLRYQFPAIEGTDRGSCVKLAQKLRADGVAVYENPEARVAHPHPNGSREFLVRALGDGRDTVWRASFGGAGWQGLPHGWILPACRRLKLAIVRIFRDYRRVGLRVGHLPVVLAVAFCFYGLCLCGATISFVSPRFARSHFRI